ncbi:MAG: ATP-binding protein [Candidatus Methanoplasma sp.]|nr:ATP-binding protein [Candidatus Methanoplasma sp.]
MKEVLRKDDLKRLEEGLDRTDVAKIITGVRRCGKSTLMLQFIRRLKDLGVDDSRIFYLNLEDEKAEDIMNHKDLSGAIRSSVSHDERVYVFLDEVQRVDGWERTVNALMVSYDADVYITGSNAFLLSSELSTFISGRYIEIDILPLSFKEYLEVHGIDEYRDVNTRFEDYLKKGSMPMIDPDSDERFRRDHLIGICNTVLTKDIAARNSMIDVSTAYRILKFLFSNVGNVTSGRSIANELHINHATVSKYLRSIEEAYLFYRVNRFDIVGKKHMNTKEKYYAVDTGLRNAYLGPSKGDDLGRLLENAVYLELRRRGYSVSVGIYRDLEIDFTADKGDRREYYQVSLTIMSDETYDREIRPLGSIGDSHPKTVLTLDRVKRQPQNGIVHTNVIDWLLSD